MLGRVDEITARAYLRHMNDIGKYHQLRIPAKTFASSGYQFCFVLTPDGWRNQGMVQNDNREPFIAEYKGYARGIPAKGTAVCFIPFCWTDNPNVMTNSQVHSYADCIY